MKKLTIFLLLLMSICLPLKISANVDVTIDVDRDIEGKTYTDFLNPESLKIIEGALLEGNLAEAKAGEKFQFVRDGYYVKDSKYENTFNRVVGLKDSFPKK